MAAWVKLTEKYVDRTEEIYVNLDQVSSIQRLKAEQHTTVYFLADLEKPVPQEKHEGKIEVQETPDEIFRAVMAFPHA